MGGLPGVVNSAVSHTFTASHGCGCISIVIVAIRGVAFSHRPVGDGKNDGKLKDKKL